MATKINKNNDEDRLYVVYSEENGQILTDATGEPKIQILHFLKNEYNSEEHGSANCIKIYELVDTGAEIDLEIKVVWP